MTFPPSDKEFLTKEDFTCVKCGECCRPIVLLNKEDIKRIESIGIKKEEFVDIDPLGDETHKILKQKNNVCMFLKKGKEEMGEATFICSIHESRPSICRDYPFFNDEKLEDCRPKGWERWEKIEVVFE